MAFSYFFDAQFEATQQSKLNKLKSFFLDVQWGSSLIDPVLLHEET